MVELETKDTHDEEKEPKKSRASFKRNSKYDSKEVKERVVQLRSDGHTWEDITNTMKGELEEPTFSITMAKKVYSRAMARTITTETRAGRKFTDFTKDLDDMYGKAIRVIQRWITAADKLSEELEEQVDKGNLSAIKAYGILLKTAPQMKAITSEIRDFMKLQRDQQEKIRVEQKDLVWDESQMLDYMDKYLKQLEKEGKIRWIKPKI